ncbi:site-2 protease family protein [Arenimonas sp.]|nr:site-2 protease family protein [Candidatus Parcubacteria bacterium]
MLTTLLFLLVLSVLVFVHELGHFLFSKLFKVRVDEFALGFPPKIFSFKKGETTYSLNALPLGGYVKIHGENPEDADNKSDKRNFQNIAPWKQVMILCAGVFFNLLFAWMLMSLTLLIGTSKVALDGVNDKYIQGHRQVLIQQILKNSPADVAGIKAGDFLLSVNGSSTTDITQVQTSIKDAPQVFSLVLFKNNATSSIVVEKSANNTIGVGLAETATVRMGLFPSIYYGLQGTYNLTTQVFSGVIGFFGKLFTGHGSWEEVSGPVGIAKVVGTSSQEGFVSLLFVTILISISLAAMNILPFPALDGGRVVIAVIEGIIKRKLPIKFVNTLNSIGFILLLTLMLVVTVKDIL